MLFEGCCVKEVEMRYESGRPTFELAGSVDQRQKSLTIKPLKPRREETFTFPIPH